MYDNLKKCVICGNLYVPKAHNSIFCPTCRADRTLTRNYREKKENPKAKKHLKRNNKSIGEVIRDMEEYNQKHGTHLTYGQYISKQAIF